MKNTFYFEGKDFRKKSNINVRVKKELFEALQKEALAKKITLSDLVREKISS